MPLLDAPLFAFNISTSAIYDHFLVFGGEGGEIAYYDFITKETGEIVSFYLFRRVI